MKTIFFKLLIIGLVFGFSACKSGVTTEDVVKQEEKARDALTDAQEEMLELAAMKEQYSEDHRDMEIRALQKRQKQIEKDIDNLEDVKTSSAEGAAGSLAAGLKDENKKLEQQVKKLESMPKENWAEAKEAINQQVAALEERLQRITANLAGQDE